VSSLRDAVSRSSKAIRLLNDVTNMPELMKWADVAVSASGSTSWEICFLGLPSILIDFAPNQTPVARELHRRGVALHVGDSHTADTKAIGAALKHLMMSQELRTTMSRKASELVDGFGAERVVSAILGYELTLRPVGMDDCRLLWEWANDPDVRASSFSTEPIAWHEHSVWFSDKLRDKKCRMLIAFEGSAPVGQIRFDWIDDREVEIDVSVAPERRGQGYGSCIIRQAAAEGFRNSSFSRLNAFIRPSNRASVKAFELAGFRKIAQVNVRGNDALHYVLERHEVVESYR
jgi:RimJ/RimL family protein N-acetyltransferase